ncbi:MAG: rab-GTPase-TBC domain-containing protein [Piptocephalis tieghemiana]|nr:MAG: rab-GTPase-TBC domain-containing protein [Piptocephalis tieghemiana]
MNTLEEFEDLLSAEVHVDVDRLRQASRHGIPEEVRGLVWKFLLEVEPADRSKDQTHARRLAEGYHSIPKSTDVEVSRRCRAECQRLLPRLPSPLCPDRPSLDIPGIVERLIATFLGRTDDREYTPGLVNMTLPFIMVFEQESDMYWCFERLIHSLDELFKEHELHERVAKFMTLLRATLPDLYNYFEEEEVDVKEWSASWMSYLLARELPIHCTIRLWDNYFCALPEERLDLHTYVCIALLKRFKEELEDLEQSEIRTILRRLPVMDMEDILNQAINVKHRVLERQMTQQI